MIHIHLLKRDLNSEKSLELFLKENNISSVDIISIYPVGFDLMEVVWKDPLDYLEGTIMGINKTSRTIMVKISDEESSELMNKFRIGSHIKYKEVT
jgi:hypothetical protein